jgi:acetolactate synthase-1/2/3 large subunit
VNRPLGKRIKACDLIIAIGPRLGEATTGGYTMFDLPVPAQKMVHVHAGAEELGRVYQATLPINSGMAQFAAAAKAMKPVDASAWKAGVAEARADYLKNIEPTAQPGSANLAEIVGWLNKRLPDDAIVTNGAGNYAASLHRFFQYPRFPPPSSRRRRLRWATACRRRSRPRSPCPERDGRVVRGDGCFLMNGQEFATAVQHGAEHRVHGHRQRHVRHDPHASGARVSDPRASGTELKNPDFAAYARAFGGHGETVESAPPTSRRPSSARSRPGQAGDHPCEDGRGGDHFAHHHEQAARTGAGQAEAVTRRAKGRAHIPGWTCARPSPPL